MVGLGPHRRGDSRPSWFGDPLQTGPMLADLGSHQIHHAAALLGTTDLSVVAARTTPVLTHSLAISRLALQAADQARG